MRPASSSPPVTPDRDATPTKARLIPGPSSSSPASAPLGFGGWAIGGSGWGAPGPETERIAAIERALELGVTFFDTAPTYGASEALLGRVLRPHRAAVTIATKVGPRDDPRVSLEASLRRLDTEYVDLLQLHEPGERFEWSLEVLAQLLREGQVRAVGLCNATPALLAAALSIAPLATYQAPYNLFDRGVELGELDLAREHRLTFIAYRPLASGLLAGSFGSGSPPAFAEGDHRRRVYWFRGHEYERRTAVIELLRPLAERRGGALAGLALAWARSRPGVSVVLVGVRTADQWDTSTTGAERPLTAAESAAIDAAIATVYRPARATGRAVQAAQGWGPREQFIVERLDGRASAEAIAAACEDRSGPPLTTAQVRVFVDQLADQGLVTFDD